MSLSSQLAATLTAQGASKAASAAKKAATAPTQAAAPTSAVSMKSRISPSPSPPPGAAAAVSAAAARPKGAQTNDDDNAWWLLVVPGRTAMLAFATAAAAEVSAGPDPRPALFDVSSLAAAHPLQFLALAAAVAAGSAAPLLRGEPHDGEAFGPFNAEAERVNSAVALVGLFGLVAVEALTGSALF